MEKIFHKSESQKITSPEQEVSLIRERAADAGEKISDIEPIIKEYANTPSKDILHDDFALKERDLSNIVLDLSPEDHDVKMAELLALIQTKGIKNTLGVVEKMNDPHLQDDFERFLVQYIKSGYPHPGLVEKSPEFKALNMTLFEITLPERNHDDVGGKTIKEIISAMEQFYAGMMSVTDKDGTGYFTIELAVANNSDDFVFYAAVHENKKSMFEKQILAIFHDAKIIEKKDDYNIFNSSGFTVGSYAQLLKNAAFPVKTYEKFDYDPLNSILNSFSKINTLGEGASIQLVIKPEGGDHNSRFKKMIEDITKGEKISEAIAKNDEGMGKYVHGFFKGMSDLMTSKEQKDKDEEKKKEAAQRLDQLTIDAIKEKISAPTLAINLRLVVSAGDEMEAKRILDDIESSFNQFQNTTGNSVIFKKVKNADLRSMIYDFSYRLFDEKKRILLNVKEATTLMHFPSTVIRSSPHLKVAKAGTSPAPLELPRDGVLLGLNSDRGKETRVFITPEDRLRHFYTIGQTGTGKTSLLKNMIKQDIINGDGVCMIDPHGSDIEDILSVIPKERYNDVIYFDPGYTPRPMALNMLEYDINYPEQKTFVVNEMLSIFNKLFDMKVAGGPMFEQYFRNSVLLTMEDPESGNTLLDVSRVLSNKSYRDLKISKCKNPIVVQFWKEVAEKAGGEASLANIVPYITSKFDVFLSNDIMRPIISQEKSTINFRDIMDNKKILLVNLSKGRLGDINANLIGLILVGKILMAALSRVDSLGKNLPSFYLYIDEFQNITTSSISTILSEARKYKLSLNIAHQFIAQLDEGIKDSVFGNVGSMAVFRIGADDAEYLEKQFAPVFSAKDLMSIDNHNAYLKILANGKPVKPFNISTLRPEKGNPEIVDALKKLSYLKFGVDREHLETLINDKYTAGSKGV